MFYGLQPCVGIFLFEQESKSSEVEQSFSLSKLSKWYCPNEPVLNSELWNISLSAFTCGEEVDGSPSVIYLSYRYSQLLSHYTGYVTFFLAIKSAKTQSFFFSFFLLLMWLFSANHLPNKKPTRTKHSTWHSVGGSKPKTSFFLLKEKGLSW